MRLAGKAGDTAHMESNASVLDRRWTRVQAEQHVAASVADVWAVLEDPDWLRWYRPLSDFAIVGGGGVVAGSVVREREWLWKVESVVDVWEEQRALGLAARAFNVPGLLRTYHRRFDLTAVDGGTRVELTGGFAFGPTGWIFLPYTYPQMVGALYFEYRSALKGLSQLLGSN